MKVESLKKNLLDIPYIDQLSIHKLIRERRLIVNKKESQKKSKDNGIKRQLILKAMEELNEGTGN
jgi:hypothetical protein